jgi:hypothetical protein
VHISKAQKTSRSRPLRRMVLGCVRLTGPPKEAHAAQGKRTRSGTIKSRSPSKIIPTWEKVRHYFTDESLEADDLSWG